MKIHSHLPRTTVPSVLADLNPPPNALCPELWGRTRSLFPPLPPSFHHSPSLIINDTAAVGTEQSENSHTVCFFFLFSFLYMCVIPDREGEREREKNDQSHKNKRHKRSHSLYVNKTFQCVCVSLCGNKMEAGGVVAKTNDLWLVTTPIH